MGGSTPRAVVFLPLLGFALLVFWPIFGQDLLRFEDGPYITDNPIVNGRAGLDALPRAFTTAPENNWIPLTWMAFAVQHVIGGGDAWVFRCVSLSLHLGCAILLVTFLQSRTGTLPALTAALVFLVHPLRVEPVAWAASQKDLWAGFFLMLAIRFYPWGNPGGSRWLLAFGAFVCSLLAKQSAVAFPLILIFFLAGRKSRRAGEWAGAGAFLGAALVATLAALLANRGSGHLWVWNDLGLSERMAMAFESTGWLVFRFLVPFDLAPEYTRPYQGLDWMLLGMFALLLWCLALRRGLVNPLILLGLAGTGLTFLPFSGLIPSPLLFTADRLTYVPALGFSVALAGAMAALPDPHRKPVLALLVLVSIAWSFISWKQTHLWKSDMDILQAARALDPTHPIATQNLGTIAAEAGDMDKAIRLWGLGFSHHPSNPLLAWNLCAALSGRGDHQQAENCALLHLGRRKDLAMAWQLAATVAEAAGDSRLAEERYRRAFALDPRAGKSAAGVLRCLLARGETAAAREFRESLPPEWRQRIPDAQDQGSPVRP